MTHQMKEKLLPIEKGIIGHCLREDCQEPLAELTAEHFMDKGCAEIFRIIVKNDLSGNNCDLVTIGAMVPEFSCLLAECLEVQLVGNNLQWAIATLKHLLTRRKYIYKIAALYNDALIADLFTPFAFDEKLMSIIDAEEVQSRITSFQKGLLTDTITAIERDVELGGTPAVSTGIEKLDVALNGGLKKGKLYTIAARPGIGKTALATNIAYAASIAGKHPLYLSLELNDKEITERIICTDSGIGTAAMSSRSFTDKHLDDLMQSCQRLAKVKFSCNSTTSGSWEKAVLSIKNGVKHYGVDIVILDYLQQFHVTSERLTIREEIVKMSRSAKQLALDLNIPIVIVAQLNRDVDKRLVKVPLLSDLKESGSIEEDSDIVVMLYRDKINPNKNDDDYDGELWVKIGKNRQGQTGNFPVNADLALNKFYRGFE